MTSDAPDRDTVPLTEHLEALGGHLDTTELLQSLYERDDVQIDWWQYMMPADDTQLADKTVVDTFREHKDDMSKRKLEVLKNLTVDELNRRNARERRGEA